MSLKVKIYHIICFCVLSTGCYAAPSHLNQKDTIDALQNSTWKIKAADINTETLRQYSLGALNKPFVYTEGEVSFGSINNEYGIGIYKAMHTHVLNGKPIFRTESKKYVKSQSQDDTDPLVVDSEGTIHLAYPSTNYQCVLYSKSMGNCFEIQMIGHHHVALGEKITRIKDDSNVSKHNNNASPHKTPSS